MASLKPGREMDRLIEEKVMGQAFVDRSSDWGRESPLDTPSYSTDIAAAWGVVEKMQTEWYIDIFSSPGGSRWCVELDIRVRNRPEDEWNVRECGEAAPEAICRAALKAAGYTDQEAPTPM